MGVREGLLALLDDGPRHGYQLKTEFEQVTGGVWPLNVGQVYTTLDRLERDGLVSVSGQDEPAGQKAYALTAAGREELGAWWQAVPGEEPPPRDELILKVLMALDHGRAHALTVVTHQRTVLLSLLQAKRRERKQADDASTAARLVTEAFVLRAEADLRWLDAVESRIGGKDTNHG